MGGDAPEEEIRRQSYDIAALAVQNGTLAELVHIACHPCVNAGAGDGHGDAVVDLNSVQRELRTVPQVFGVPELVHMITEVLKEIVACSDGNNAHGGIAEANNAVGHLVQGAVAAAGVKPQVFPGLAELAGQLRGVTLPLSQDALDVQTMIEPQRVGHVIYALAAVGFACRGIDDENMLHKPLPKEKDKNTPAIIAVKAGNLCIN